MNIFDVLPGLAELPVAALLAAVVLALVWTLTRILMLMPRLPNSIVDAVSQAGQKSALALKQTVDELQEMIHELQIALREERRRLDEANNEISRLKQVHALDEQVAQLTLQVQDLDRRLAA